jgi:hypothetical protein
MTTSSVYDTFVPVFSTSPEKPEDLRNFTTEQLRIHATGINVREVGWMVNTQLLTGKRFLPGTSTGGVGFRSVFRIVVNFGALPNTGTKSVAHGIQTVDANFSLVQMWASATKPTVAYSALPIPYVDTAGNVIELNMDATNVNISTTADYSAYTICYVVIEFLLQG